MTLMLLVAMVQRAMMETPEMVTDVSAIILDTTALQRTTSLRVASTIRVAKRMSRVALGQYA